MTQDEIIKLLLNVTDSGTINEATTKLRELGKEAVVVTEETEKATKGHRDFGSVMLQSSYAVQDFTSQLGTRGLAGALGAIQNNIPGILFGLGVGPGIAGVVSVAAVAVGALVPQLQSMYEAMTSNVPIIAADKLKQFTEDAKKAKEQWDKLVATPTKVEAAAGKAIGETIAELGPEALAEGFTGAMGKTGMSAQLTPTESGQMQQLQAEMARNRGLEGPEATRNRQAQIDQLRIHSQQRIQNENRAAVEKMIENLGAKGATGEAARRMASDLMGVPGMTAQFPGFAGDIEGADPAAFKAQQELEGQGKIRGEMLSEKAKQRTKEEADFRRERDRQVKDEERRTRKEIEDADKEIAQQRRTEEHAISEGNAAQKRLDAKATHDTDKAKHDADHAMREAKHQADHLAQLAKQAIQERLEDAQYWMKFNAGQITMMDQLNRQAQIQKRALDHLASGQNGVMAGIQQSLQGSALPR